MRKYGKKDGNHDALRKSFEVRGASFLSLASHGDDAPDGLVGYSGVDQLVEFKSENRKLRGGQIEWHGKWRGRKVAVVRTDTGVESLLKSMRFNDARTSLFPLTSSLLRQRTAKGN